MRPYPSVSAALIAAVVAGLVALALPAGVAHAQLVTSRSEVLLNPSQAIDRVAEFVVRNSGGAAVQATVQLEDWEVDARGVSRWRQAGKVAGACGERVVVSPRNLRLEPGAAQTVRVTVSGGAQFPAECWTAAVVTPEEAPTVVSAAVSVYVTPTESTADGELRDMVVKGDSLEVVFANTGNRRVEIIGEVQVRAPGDSLVMVIPLEGTTVLSGASRRMRAAMPKLRRGPYMLWAVVDFGGAELTAVQAALEIR